MKGVGRELEPDVSFFSAPLLVHSSSYEAFLILQTFQSPNTAYQPHIESSHDELIVLQNCVEAAPHTDDRHLTHTSVLSGSLV